MTYLLKLIKKTCQNPKCNNTDREEVWVLKQVSKKKALPVEMIGFNCKCDSQKIPDDLDIREYNEPTLPIW